MAGVTDPRIAAATAPLPPDAPDPASFRYEAEFEALDREIRKLERDGPSAIPWPSVVRQAEAILATRSKDLSVAVWLATGLAHAEGVRGLAVGLAILRDLIEQNWDTLFPPRNRARARVGVIEWLAGRTARTLPPSPLTAEQAEPVLAAQEALEAIDKALVDKLPPDGASVLDLLRPLRALAEEARALAEPAAPPPVAPIEAPPTREAATTPSPASAASPPTPPPPPTPTPTPPPTPTAASIPIPVAPPPPASGADAEKALLALRESVRATALAILQANPAEPRAYALLRAVTWIGITDPPPDTAGTTALMPPPEQRDTEFAALRTAGNLPDLVLALERYCSGSGIFWLDGQRLAANALAELGPTYAASVTAIVHGLGGLLMRLPTLPGLRFANGRPFADPTTRAWIETVVLPQPAAAEAGSEAEPWRAAYAAARERHLQGQAEAGLLDLVTRGRGAPDGRARFHWALAQARFCLDTGAAPVALGILRQLETTADMHGLEAWEPDAVTEVTKLIHDCLDAPEFVKSLAEADRNSAKAAVFARLARLDPVLATRIAKLSG